MTATRTPPPPLTKPTRSGFASVLRSEWTKFRTVRSWTIGLIAAAALMVAFAFVVSNGNHEGGCTGAPPPGSPANAPGTGCFTGHPFVPTGPEGEAVADSYQFVERPLAGNGTLTAQITSITGRIWDGPANRAPSLATTRPGLAPWAKAGILLTPSTEQGSAYAAIMATGSKGIHFQYNYSHDETGGSATTAGPSPRWLRLTRAGDILTSYDSTDGASWAVVGTTRLAGLRHTVQIGLFATSPVSFQSSTAGAPTQATATFDHITLTGSTTTGTWENHSIGTGARDFYPTLGPGSSKSSGSAFVVAGSGDIAPAVNPLAGGSTAPDNIWFGLLVALLVVVMIATISITTEYRRGLIRTTFTATPRRVSVLAAKAVIIGGVAFATGAVAAAVAIPVASHILVANGNYVFPLSALAMIRVTAGSGALLALTAVAVLALGTILRTSSGGVTAGIVLFVLSYILGRFLTGSAQEWMFRLSPAAAFSVLGAVPRSALVDSAYTFDNGYFPLDPWAGILVLGAYTAVALGAATLVLRRSDA